MRFRAVSGMGTSVAQGPACYASAPYGVFVLEHWREMQATTRPSLLNFTGVGPVPGLLEALNKEWKGDSLLQASSAR